MAQESISRNPFMLMMHPELVLAAIEKSERLGQLNRHLCRPLDRPSAQAPGTRPEGAGAVDEFDGDDEAGS
jgi:hypothetical protein